MKGWLLTYLLFPMALFLMLMTTPGCNKPGCLGKAGTRSTVTRTLASFNQVKLEDNIDLVLIQGNSYAIELEGPVNILPSIETVIVGDMLSIRNTAECRWARDPDEKIVVRLTFPTLARLIYEASGNVTNLDTLRLDALDIQSNTGAGNVDLTVETRYTGVFINEENAGVTMHGYASQCNTYVTARGQLHIQDLAVSKLTIEYGGLADCRVHAIDELSAIIYYKGNVLYSGSPAVTQETYYSSGRLIHVP